MLNLFQEIESFKKIHQIMKSVLSINTIHSNY